MIPNSAISDLDRLAFLQALARAIRAENGLLLDAWDSSFVGSFCSSSRPSLWFTPARRAAADRLRMKHGDEKEIRMPYPLAAGGTHEIPAADPNGCQFLIHNEAGRQVPCNEPAEWQRENHFRYCTPHKDDVLRDLKRRGQTMHVIPFTSKP